MTTSGSSGMLNASHDSHVTWGLHVSRHFNFLFLSWVSSNMSYNPNIFDTFTTNINVTQEMALIYVVLSQFKGII